MTTVRIIAVTVTGLACVAAIVRGVWLMLLAGDGRAIRCTALVRQVRPQGLFGLHATLIISLEEAAVQVECHLPGEWFMRPRARPADRIRVLWRRGEACVVAERTIRHGQVLLIMGFAVLTAGVLAIALMN